MKPTSTLAPLLCLTVFATATYAGEAADRIFVNGNVWTGDDAQPRAQALAIGGQNLLAVGGNDAVRKLAGPDTAVIDLGGRMVVPGFEDCHAHFPGQSVNQIGFEGVSTLAQFQQRLREFAQAHPGDGWIVGYGWTYSFFPGNKPTRAHIDAAVADRPVYLSDRDGHVGLANTAALRAAGITRETPDPQNGTIARNGKREPTGELAESAQRLMDAFLPQPSAEDLYRTLLKNFDDAAATGLTAIQNAHWTPDEHALFVRALAADKLKLRFRFAASIIPNVPPAEGKFPKDHKLRAPLAAADLADYDALRATFRGPMLKLGAVKGFLDGTVDAKTAAMFEPYIGSDTSGLAFWSAEELNATVALYDKAGYQVLLHAIGDKAVSMALDAYENAARVNGTRDRRHRVEHVEVAAPADLPRFEQLGVIPCTQAAFASPDATTLGNYAPLLGPERAARSNAFRKFDDAGAIQAFGSDWEVFPISPLYGMYIATTRTMPDGTPKGGWNPQNRISIEAALRHYTRDAAYSVFDEPIRGTLTAGKLADFVVLSDDILKIAPEKLLDVTVLRTVMGGRDTYRAD